MSHEISRRRFLVNLAAAGALVPLMRVGVADAAGLPHLTQKNNSLAKQNDYVDNVKQIDPKKESKYKPGERCGNCTFFQGGSKTWGSCMVYPGYDVNTHGWCKAYTPKS